MPSPIQIAIAIGLSDIIHMEASVELGYEQRSASAWSPLQVSGGALAGRNGPGLLLLRRVPPARRR